MRFICIVFLLFVTPISASTSDTAPEDFFIGSFQSDKESTIARWKAEQRFGDKTQRIVEILGEILGKHRVHTTRTHVKSESDGHVEVQPYEVIERSKGMIRSRIFSSEYDRYMEGRLEAAADGYWVFSDDPVKGYCEKYRRIIPDASSRANASEQR